MIFYFSLNVIGYVCVCVCVCVRERERERERESYLTMGLRHKEKHFTHLFRFHSPVPPPVLFESSVSSIYWFTEHTIVSDEDGIMRVGGMAGRRHNGYLPVFAQPEISITILTSFYCRSENIWCRLVCCKLINAHWAMWRYTGLWCACGPPLPPPPPPLTASLA